jgi:23S rRNA pseudouridine1911/1915/1917 synthase
VHGDETGDDTLADAVKRYIKVRYKKPGDVFLGVIHRLDRPVSGVVVFARTSKVLISQKSSYLCGVRGIRPAPSELPQGRNAARVGS